MKSKAKDNGSILPFEKGYVEERNREMEEMRKARTKKMVLSEIEANQVSMRHQLNEMQAVVNQTHVDLNAQMGRMDHHFKNIMVEISGVLKEVSGGSLIKRRKR